MKSLSSLLAIGILSLVGYEKEISVETPTIRAVATQSQPVLKRVNYDISGDRMLKIDLVHEGTPAQWEISKIDLKEGGSYGLIGGLLHFYKGGEKREWINVEADCSRDSWKKQLKQELMQKFNDQYIEGEVYHYSSGK